MTPEEMSIVVRCANALCRMCANPEKWKPAELNEGDWYHLKVNRPDDTCQWCDANAIWNEFLDEERVDFQKL